MEFKAYEFVQTLRKKIKDCHKNKTAFYADFDKEGLGVEEKAAAFDAMVRELFDQEENIRIEMMQAHNVRLTDAVDAERAEKRLRNELERERISRAEDVARHSRKELRLKKALDAATNAANFKPLAFVVKIEDKNARETTLQSEDEAREYVGNWIANDPGASLQVLALMAGVRAKWVAPTVQSKPKRGSKRTAAGLV